MIRIFDSNVKSVLLHGSETWKLAKKIIAQLQAITKCRLWYMYPKGVVAKENLQ